MFTIKFVTRSSALESPSGGKHNCSVETRFIFISLWVLNGRLVWIGFVQVKELFIFNESVPSSHKRE